MTHDYHESEIFEILKRNLDNKKNKTKHIGNNFKANSLIETPETIFGIEENSKEEM